MTTENALSTAIPAATGDAANEHAADPTKTTTPAAEGTPAEGSTGEPAKKEKTPEERERARMQRRIDNLTARYHRTAAELERVTTARPGSGEQLTDRSIAAHNDGQQADNEPLSLTRAQLRKLIEDEAHKLAPTISQQETEVERRRSIVTGLETELGKEKFDALAADLDDAFDGLLDAHKRPKPAFDAIVESDDARALIEYLADPDHADEAKALARMSPLQAGRAVAKLETKLATIKVQAKPQASKVADPIEAVRGSGTVNAAPNPADTKAWIRWANEQERRGK